MSKKNETPEAMDNIVIKKEDLKYLVRITHLLTTMGLNCYMKYEENLGGGVRAVLALETFNRYFIYGVPLEKWSFLYDLLYCVYDSEIFEMAEYGFTNSGSATAYSSEVTDSVIDANRLTAVCIQMGGSLIVVNDAGGDGHLFCVDFANNGKLTFGENDLKLVTRLFSEIYNRNSERFQAVRERRSDEDAATK